MYQRNMVKIHTFLKFTFLLDFRIGGFIKTPYIVDDSHLQFNSCTNKFDTMFCIYEYLLHYFLKILSRMPLYEVHILHVSVDCF